MNPMMSVASTGGAVNTVANQTEVGVDAGVGIGKKYSEQTMHKKRQLEKIMKQCLKENKQLQNEFKEIDYEMLIYNLQQNQFEQLSNRVKEVEYANPHVLE